MTFANPLPWWGILLSGAALGLVAWLTYRRAGPGGWTRGLLASLRAATLLLLLVVLMRPVRVVDGESERPIVPILLDASRSMGIADVDGRPRIDRAREVLTQRLLPALEEKFRVEVLAFGDHVRAVPAQTVRAADRRSDISQALAAVAERYGERIVPGIVLLSDGGDTGGPAQAETARSTTPIHALGFGAEAIVSDREVVSLTAAETVLDGSRIDLAVTAVSHGAGAKVMTLRLLENGRPAEARAVTPPPGSVPVREVFQVTPPDVATVYSVEVATEAGELVRENNSRSIIVQAPSRVRRILLVEGAPGFEHSFLKRAWAGDPGLAIDSIVRKGKNEEGADTFYIQASGNGAGSLVSGYPRRLEDLFAYDAVVLANVETGQLSPTELAATQAFVARRGGGLLVLGTRSFSTPGLANASDVLPLELSGAADAAASGTVTRGPNLVALTPEGQSHPIMQLGPTREATQKRWNALPALGSVAPLGGARPGATVLAVASEAGGTSRALVAVQRYGEGRVMVFAGEAAWRWRMLLPASDRSYETFWRQAVRWLALPASDPVALTLPLDGNAGDELGLKVLVRSAAFEPRSDAVVDVFVTSPDGRVERFGGVGEGGQGRYAARFRPHQPGVYRVSAEARVGTAILGSAAAALLVGGSDPEMSDPRLNLDVLRRLAQASGGGNVDAHDISALVAALGAAVPAARASLQRDVWHNGWWFGAIVMLLAAEWMLRRRRGLR